MHPANPFAKQSSAMPYALVPSLDNGASLITAVRRSREVGYRRSDVSFEDDSPVNPPLVPTFEYFLTCLPFVYVSDPEGPMTVQLTTARNHRVGLTEHLVAWHPAEYSSCATATHSRFYLPTPAWWFGTEVPYGYSSASGLSWRPSFSSRPSAPVGSCGATPRGSSVGSTPSGRPTSA